MFIVSKIFSIGTNYTFFLLILSGGHHCPDQTGAPQPEAEGQGFGPRASVLGWHRLTLGEVVLEDVEALVGFRDEAEGFVGGGCNAGVGDLAAIFQDAVDGEDEVVHGRTFLIWPYEAVNAP